MFCAGCWLLVAGVSMVCIMWMDMPVCFILPVDMSIGTGDRLPVPKAIPVNRLQQPKLSLRGLGMVELTGGLIG